MLALASLTVLAAAAQDPFAGTAPITNALPGDYDSVPRPVDVDGDGIPDLVCVGGRSPLDSNLLFLRGLGGRAFTPGTEVPLEGRVLGLPAAADLDGDGDEDLVGGLADPDGRLVILRAESGSFVQVFGPVQGDTTVFDLHDADADADGDLDLYFSVRVGFQTRVRVALLEGAQFTGEVRDGFQNLFTEQYFVADFDGDRRGDVLRRSGDLRLATPSGFGPAVPIVPASSDSFANAGYPADLDLDGIADLIVVKTGSGTQEFTNSVLIGDGALGFTEVQLVQDAEIERLWNFADANGDGFLDVFYSSASGFRLSFGMGSLPYPPGVLIETFRIPPDLSGSIGFTWQIDQDLDGDGRDDRVRLSSATSVRV
ncbi:MAG: VCBS repeat-containing protein, partial [Planctomycetota bacterium]